MPKKGCCVIQECRNSSDKTAGSNITYHKFPTNGKMRKRWLRMIQVHYIKFEVDWESSTTPRLCSEHFEDDDFLVNKNGKAILKLTAIPTIFLTNSPKGRSRHQSRRAASKEALKQMQSILEDEDDTVEIPDDDDYDYRDEIKQEPLEVNLSALTPYPPKKKYKLSHRKSSDDRDVLVLKTIPAVSSITNSYNDNSLELDCCVEELEPCQVEWHNKLEKESQELEKQLEMLVEKCGGEIIHKGDLTTIIEISEHVEKTLQAVQNSQNDEPVVLNKTITINKQSGSQSLVDPKISLVVKTPPQKSGKIPIKNLNSTPLAKKLITPSTSSSSKKNPSNISESMLKKNLITPILPKIRITRSSETPIKQTTTTTPKKTKSSLIKPKEIVDLTEDDGKDSSIASDSREISFNKVHGKTFPSLMVCAKPHLRVNLTNTTDRPKLDTKVKTVLMYAPSKFIEWLLQQGLIKCEQKCTAHPGNQLKLGIYSDVSKFPHSGGYIWISECCPARFSSVFMGSLFENLSHPPLVILKLIYHWACQTNIQNVTQWVKVDNLYVKTIYNCIRAVCTVALQSYCRQLGGPNRFIEVGVISLGTTTQDGSSRHVKVEVLGVLETTTKMIRLRAVEPLQDGDRNQKKRFLKILQPLAKWVHPASTIVTDMTVDLATLRQIGFTNVIQSNNNNSNSSTEGTSNRTIMEYLRQIVPRMFQNTLSLLSRQIIQQFLNELVWREWFGTTPLEAFDNLIAHIAEQTTFDYKGNHNGGLIAQLNRVSNNPFRNWTIVSVPSANSEKNKTVSTTNDLKKRKREVIIKHSAPSSVPESSSKSTLSDEQQLFVPLENYYYGTIDNYPSKTNITLNLKCILCKETLNNNILLMNHLFKHVHNITDDSHMCKYCLTCLVTETQLLKHIKLMHPNETKNENGYICLICEAEFTNSFLLGKHMSKEHRPAELPYQCGTCTYRCSNHKQVIDHFYTQHDKGPTIQCPFCLKSTTVFSSSRNISHNMSYFVEHLKNHQKKHPSLRCKKCNLYFVQNNQLKDHLAKMHVSQRGKVGLIPWIAPKNRVMVPKSQMDTTSKDDISFNKLHINVEKNLKCKECQFSMDVPNHFSTYQNCPTTHCLYSTCCSSAMQEHTGKCSKISSSSSSATAGDKLPEEMFCVCEFHSNDGNQLAHHLAICEKKSVYSSLDEAKSAIATHSMLDVLGLIRNNKPEEVAKKSEVLIESNNIDNKNADNDEPASKENAKINEEKDVDVKNVKNEDNNHKPEEESKLKVVEEVADNNEETDGIAEPMEIDTN